MASDEIFEVVDENNNVIGTALRRECHGDPSLIHRTSHVAVFHPDGKLLLQKRSMKKDVQPGRWDTAVGGHLMPGETFALAARREAAEEIGLPSSVPLKYLFEMKIRNQIESENTAVFMAVYTGPFKFPEEEIDELRFWAATELKEMLDIDSEEFTPNLKVEIRKLLEAAFLK